VHVEVGQFSPSDGEVATGRLLDADNGVTALIVGSNQMVPGVLRVLQTRRLRIPADMSIVAFEDLPLLSAFDPPISIVSRQPLVVGEEAAQLLLRRLEGGEPEVDVVPTLYVRRHSCGAPPA
jgi:LacI family transcriptional regulator